MTQKFCNLFINDAIPTRLFKIVFGFYIFVALAVTSFHMIFEYYYMKNSIQYELQNLQKTFEQGLYTSLWRIDIKQLKSTIAGIVEVPSIEGIRVTDTTGDISLSSGLIINDKGEFISVDLSGNKTLLNEKGRRFNDLFWYDFSLKSFDDDVVIGSVRLYSSSRVVFGRVQLGFLFIIINSIIKSAALWFIFINVSQRLLTRPLSDLTDATRKINFNNLENFKVQVVELKGVNELKTLEDAFNRMIRKLHESSSNLKRAEEVSRTILESSPNPIIVYDTYDNIIYLNPAFTRVFGWTATEFVNSNIPFIPAENKSETDQALAQVKTSNKEYIEFDSCRHNKAGENINVHITTAVYRNLNHSIIGRVHTLQDITQRKKAESELKKRENLYRMIFENSPIGIVHYNEKGVVTACNDAMSRILGFFKSSAIGYNLLYELQNENLKSAVHKVLNGGGASFEGEYKGISDESYSWIKAELRPIFENTETVAGIGIFEDITKRKQYEEYLNQAYSELEKKVEERTFELKESLNALKKAQNDLIRSERLVALGSMVAGVAHEINTPLGIGVTATSYLNDKLQDISKLFEEGTLKKSDFENFLHITDESTTIVSSNLERATDLIQSFKQVAVDQSGEKRRKFNLNSYIHDVLLSLRPKYKKTSHTITVNCPDDIELDSYPGAFSQIITNLLNNSLIHAFENMEKGEIIFDIEKIEDELYFNYTDNGVGMEPRVANQIFDPFFTTKRTTGGTGLGMHIVYNLVSQQLGGYITCISDRDKGTQFKIVLNV